MTPYKKKVVLISSGQPSINPRLVKEADALAENNIDVTVLYQYWNGWATALDEKLLGKKKWKAIRVGGDPVRQKWKYRWTRVRQKASAFLFAKTGSISYGVNALARSGSDLINAARRIKADLYIGHNLGALPATVLAAQYHKTKCGFDAEDFHRNEVANEPSDPDVKLKTTIEDCFYPHLNYMSTASPLITAKYQQLYPELMVHTINNVFPKAVSCQPVTSATRHELKLFWFSQTIGINRGLEDIFKALGKLTDLPIELHLLGHLNKRAAVQLEALRVAEGILPSTIYYHGPIDADRIVSFASQFDIGLATETGNPYNREICLTNKVFTYMQAGLSILASDTLAQSQLIADHPQIGRVYKRKDVNRVIRLLKESFKDRDGLAEQKKASLLLAKCRCNWEQESQLFIDLVNAQLR